MADISIIIPTRNRARALHHALTSIATVVTSRSPVEIIVVDNGSIDDTARIYSEIKDRFAQLDWRYFYDETPGQLTGRHLGAREARGEILAFLDDDILLAPSWLEALSDSFGDARVTLAGGPVEPCYEVTPPLWLSGMWVEFEQGVRVLGELSLIDLGDTAKEVDPLYIGGLNFCIRRSVFQQCGGFHPDYLPTPLQRYQGDGETGLALKVRAQNLKAAYHPGLAMKHIIPATRLTPESFERRGFYQGVCNSYTSIRQMGFLPLRTKLWKEFIQPLKWKLERKRLGCNPTANNVAFLVARARIAGRRFHEKEVRNDPKLLKWILKPNYLDYQLPDGWEKYRGPWPYSSAAGWR